MTKHIFYYNGKSTADFGIYISGEDTWKKPAPDLERTEIPGRNGDLVSTNRRYKNIDIEYHAGIIHDFDTNYSGFTNFLLSSPGYHRLEDSYHPEVYRMGVMESSFEPEMAVANKAGKFNVRFSCKPQMFLKAGEQERTFFSSGVLVNPTLFEAKPLIRVWGTGRLEIGSEAVTITKVDDYIDIDCDLQDAYKDTAAKNCNSNIILYSDQFPTIPPGKADIVLGHGITKVVIIPRWWTL